MSRNELNQSFRLRRSMLRSFPVLLLLVVLSAQLATDLGAQGRPDLSGAWTSAGQGQGGRGGGGGATAALGSGWGPSFTIEQDENLLTITRVFFSRGDLQPPIKYRFALDGSETRNVILMGRGMQEEVSTSRWEGDRLIITTQYDVVAGEERVLAEVTHTLSLRPPSAGRAAWPPSLVVETEREGVLGGPPSTAMTVYNRS